MLFYYFVLIILCLLFQGISASLICAYSSLAAIGIFIASAAIAAIASVFIKEDLRRLNMTATNEKSGGTVEEEEVFLSGEDSSKGSGNGNKGRTNP